MAGRPRAPGEQKSMKQYIVDFGVRYWVTILVIGLGLILLVLIIQ